MRIIYADPPYPGMAKKHYGERAQEVDHRVLIQGLEENSDGWALSTGSSNLHHVLPLCPEKARVCAWCKSYNAMHQNVSPIYAWEPVIVKPARINHKSPYFIKDYIVVNAPIFDRSTKCTSDIHGQKPEGFYFWMFRMVGAVPGDEFIDLFPGSGNGDRFWKKFQAQTSIIEFKKGAL